MKIGALGRVTGLYQLQWWPYEFALPRPVVTAHGIWRSRRVIILRLTDREGRESWGEIAPIPWFGTETLEQAEDFLRLCGTQITADTLEDLGDSLPACQFGLGCGLWGLTREPIAGWGGEYGELLPTGEAGLAYLESHALECATVKWKIGVTDRETEQNLLTCLVAQLPSCTRLRLDANGGLTFDEARHWLDWLEAQDLGSVTVEYVEQPLPPSELAHLFTLANQFKTAIALDESVAQLGHLQTLYKKNWPGIYVLKAPLMGDPRLLHAWLQTHPIPAIFSSVFETAIARCWALHLAHFHQLPSYAVGFSPQTVTVPIPGLPGP